MMRPAPLADGLGCGRSRRAARTLVQADHTFACHPAGPSTRRAWAPFQPWSPSTVPSAPSARPRPNRTGVVMCAAAEASPSPSPAGPALPPAPFWRTHISRKPMLLQSLYECLAGIKAHGPLPDKVDLAMVFVSSAYEPDFPLLVEALRQQVPGLQNVFGCTGFGIIGVDGDGAHEVEGTPALSITLAAIPQADVVVRHVDTADLPDGDAGPDRWGSMLGVPAFPEVPLSLVVLSDPSFSGVQDLLAGLDYAFPTATKIGGLSSSTPSFKGSATATFAWSASAPRAGLLAPAAGVDAAAAAAAAEVKEDVFTSASASSTTVAGDSTSMGGSSSPSSSASTVEKGASSGVHLRGATVLSLHGEVQMDLIVAQGCRPLTSTTWTVDRVAPGDPTRIVAMSCEKVGRGKSLPALEAFQAELQSVLGGMSEGQLRRTVANLTVGVAPEGLKASLEPQDFLIRSLRGFDTEQCLVVGDYMRAGQRLRFMVRDKQGAQEDLTSHGMAFKRKQLQGMMMGGADQQPPPFGMLMFTCNGRGSGLYGEESYDARTMSTYVPVPCAGFQCNAPCSRSRPAAMASLVFGIPLLSGSSRVMLLDTYTYRPPQEFKANQEDIARMWRESERYSEEDIRFMERVFANSGLSPTETNLPPTLHPGFVGHKARTDMLAAEEECRLAVCGAVEGMFKQTGLRPKDIDIVVTTCSVYCPTPSMASMVVNQFGLRKDIQAYHLGGMGCSNGVVSVNMVADLLKAHPNSNALFVTTETLSPTYYAGCDRHRLLGLLLFRMGAAAVVMTNKPSLASRAKYVLQRSVRVHTGQSDDSFSAIRWTPDPTGLLGMYLGKNVCKEASKAMSTAMMQIAPHILTWGQLAAVALDTVKRNWARMTSGGSARARGKGDSVKHDGAPRAATTATVTAEAGGCMGGPGAPPPVARPYTPSFQESTVTHFLLHAGGARVLADLGEALHLDESRLAPSRDVLWDYGNVSSSTTWYALTHVETLKGVKKGERVLQVGVGSGIKCGVNVWKALRDVRNVHDAWAHRLTPEQREEITAKQQRRPQQQQQKLQAGSSSRGDDSLAGECGLAPSVLRGVVCTVVLVLLLATVLHMALRL